MLEEGLLSVRVLAYHVWDYVFDSSASLPKPAYYYYYY